MNFSKSLKQLFVYLIVGGIATVAEWASFYLLDDTMGINYMLATTIAFAFSTFVNWLAGKILLFKENKDGIKELIQIYLTSIAGLIFNLIIMWVAIEIFSIPNFVSKVIATGIVFFWNFIIRKLFIYKI